MKGDFTRFTFRKEKHYSSVRRQQGRVDLDADWNEQADIDAYLVETETCDVIGACGVPKRDAGFSIVDPTALSAAEQSALLPLGSGDFLLGSGRAYVDGILCENEEIVSFTDQPDLRPDPLTTSHRYCVYLDVWQRHLTALDDPEIREVALGGPDTATRTKTVWQVRALDVGAAGAAVTCSSNLQAWDDAIAPSIIKLSARAAQELPSDKPCILPPGAGYRRLENQLYRVEIHDGGNLGGSSAPTFKWSRDNGSIVALIDSIAVAGTVTLTFARFDSALGFVEGQWIELLDDRNDWSGTPGVLIPITKVDDLILTLDATQAIGALNQFVTGLDKTFHPKARRWDSVGVTTATIPATNDGFLPLEDGVEVKFENGACKTGDYWVIPARTDHGDVEWLQDSAAPSNPVPQSPKGIVHHFCRLAIVDVDGTGKVTFIEDCRLIFPPLTEIDDCCGCCTKTVGQTKAADFQSIQAAIKALPIGGGHICVLAGEYTESVLIDGKQNITITGCGELTVLHPGAPPKGQQEGPIIEIKDSTNIRVESLALIVGLHSAVAVFQSQRVAVRECKIQMTDPKGSEPAIFFQANEGLIERNFISGGDARASLSLKSATPLHAASGIQLAGGCRQVRVMTNLIIDVRGQGITLGSLEQANPDGGDGKPVVGGSRDPKDPCDDCHSVGTRVPTRPPPRQLTSPESLKDIYIERNRIRSAGLDGIGVIGFFDLSEADEFITVRRLTILGNEISDCLWLAPAPVESAMKDSMGYGGISLADVSELVVYDNVIVRNGTGHSQPVCGIFVLHGEGIDIERNRILGNGSQTRLSNGGGKVPISAGRRGGIQIVYALAPVAPSASLGAVNPAVGIVKQLSAVPEPTGFPALKVHDNIVSAPAGPALSAVALGPVSVVGNQFTSDGLNQGDRSFVFAPATVFVFNLGVSNEAYLQQALFANIGQKAPPAVTGLDDYRVGDRLANGNILFTDNQCSLDLLETGTGSVFTSLALASLDDIGFQDNQCDCNLRLRQDFVVAHALLLSASLRVTGNRFKEGLFQAAYSGVTVGLLNTTTHNQATHCLKVTGLPALTHNTPNTILVDSISPRYCGRELSSTLTNLAAIRRTQV